MALPFASGRLEAAYFLPIGEYACRSGFAAPIGGRPTTPQNAVHRHAGGFHRVFGGLLGTDMAAASSEGVGRATRPDSGADSRSGLPVADGGGAAASKKVAALGGAEATGDSEEDGEDVFEVEQILDMKTEGVCAAGSGRGSARTEVTPARGSLPRGRGWRRRRAMQE